MHTPSHDLHTTSGAYSLVESVSVAYMVWEVFFPLPGRSGRIGQEDGMQRKRADDESEGSISRMAHGTSRLAHICQAAFLL
jgi:hypothetical protein